MSKYNVRNEETVYTSLKKDNGTFITVSDSDGYMDVEIKRSSDGLGYIIDVWHKDRLVNSMNIWDLLDLLDLEEDCDDNG